MPNVQEAPERLTGNSDRQASFHIAVEQRPAAPAGNRGAPRNPSTQRWFHVVSLRNLIAGVLREMLESRFRTCSFVTTTGQDINPLSNPA